MFEVLAAVDLCMPGAPVEISHVACEKQAWGNKIRKEFNKEFFSQVIVSQELGDVVINMTFLSHLQAFLYQ